MNVPGSRTIMQREAYAATNVVPIFLARSAQPEVHPLVALSRHPWRKTDVAGEFGVSIRTVSRYMKQGLPYCKPFGARGELRFEPRAVRTWARRRPARSSLLPGNAPSPSV